jgi:hypothetical protein
MSSAVHTSSRVCTEPTVATGNLEADAGAANLVLEPNAFLVWDLKNLREERLRISARNRCVSVKWARRNAATHMARGRVDQLDGTGPGLDDCIMARKGS